MAINSSSLIASSLAHSACAVTDVTSTWRRSGAWNPIIFEMADQAEMGSDTQEVRSNDKQDGRW